MAAAAEIRVPARAGALQAALGRADPGATLILDPGTHAGPLVIDRPVRLVGRPGAVVAGDGSGSVVRIDAPDVSLRGLTIVGSGLALAEEDSAVFVTARAARAVIEGNTLRDNLIGVYLKGPAEARVLDNEIIGRRDAWVNRRGNGVQIWNATGAAVVGNRFRYGRDGVFVTTARRVRFDANHFADLRFAVHYMYSHDGRVSDNVSRGNHLGYALMYSDRVSVRGNLSDGDRDHGILMNFANHGRVEGNTVRGGAEKCLFVYNANRNHIRHNRFRDCAIGIHHTGSAGNVVAGNAFIGNRTQVKYVGTRDLIWAEAGRGNYWSDNPGFDVNGDGIAERPYRPNDIMDAIVWRQPLAAVLQRSPAAAVLRWAQSVLPGLTPGGVVDPAPLMAPPVVGG